MEITFRHYLRWFFGTVVIICAGIILFNYKIDPFSIYHPVDYVRIGWRDSKSEAFSASTIMRLNKAFILKSNAERHAPIHEYLILGNSRSMCGIDPTNPLFQGKAFNGGMPGATMYEIFRYLQHANALHPIHHVILSLDYIMFNPERKVLVDFDEDRLAVTPEGKKNYLYYVHDLPSTLLSWDALKKSYENTSFGKKKEMGPPPNQIESLNAFQHSVVHEVEEIKSFKNKSPREGEMLQEYQKFLKYCSQNKIEVHVFISPIHVYNFLVPEFLNHNIFVEQWKREITRINQEEGLPVGSCIDFSGFNRYTSEPVEGMITEMKWYYESSHYKPMIGAQILEQLENKNLDPTFGRVITADNIEQVLEAIRTERKVYGEKNAADVERVQKWVLECP
ncbi:MAG: hypothetical protein V4507_03300 [Verrucomicrobiota bacterium]